MRKELDELRAIFLTDVDEDIRRENLDQIRQWEEELVHNEAMLGWREHDITKAVFNQAREVYRDAYRVLAENRALTQEQRVSLWAKQDAAAWLISIIDTDPQGAIQQIESDIKRALQAA